MLYTSPEAQLLVYCVTAHINPNKYNKGLIEDTLKKDIDWDNFLYITGANKVIPMVWKSLNTFINNKIPNYVLNQLQDAYYKLVSHHIIHLNELKNLLVQFKKNDIPIIPFKGAVLGTFYSKSTLRQWGDLDIIVHKENIIKVKELLNINGYEPSSHPANLQLNKLLESDHAYYFVRKDGTVKIDVHWRLTNDDDEINFPMKRIWNYHTQQVLFGVEVATMDPEDLILSTCIHHGVRNGWDELRYVADFAILIDAYQQLNWMKIIAYADNIRIKRALVVGICLANLIFKVTIPSQFDKEIIRDKNVKILQISIYNKLFINHNLRRMYFINLIKIYLREDFQTRLLLWNNLIKSSILHLIIPNEIDKFSIKSKSWS